MGASSMPCFLARSTGNVEAYAATGFEQDRLPPNIWLKSFVFPDPCTSSSTRIQTNKLFAFFRIESACMAIVAKRARDCF